MADAQSILTPLQIPQSVKADAWDAVQSASSPDDLTARLQKLPLSNSTRADLWDAGQSRLSQQEPMTVGGFAKNAMTSTGNLIGNLYNAARHPLNTVKGAADIVAGGLNAIGGQEGDTGAAAESDAKFNAVADAMKKRYGSFDALKHTLYTDPAGAMADLSMIADGVGGVAGKVSEAADAAKLSEVADAARTVRTVAKTAAENTNPVALVAKPVVKAVTPLVRRAIASRTTLLPEEIAAPLQEQADAASAAATQTGEAAKAEIAAARTKVQDVRDAEVARINAAKASGETAVKQSTAATTAEAQAFTGRFAGALDNTKFGGLDDVAKAATSGDAQAAQLLDTLKAATTPDQIQRASIALQDYRTSQTATGLYDKVGKLIAQHDLPDVPLTGTTRALEDVSGALGGDLNPAANKNVARVVEGIRAKLAETKEVPAAPPEPATPKAAAPAAEPAAGQPAAAPERTSATNIPIPGTDRSYPATYQIVERADVKASHNAQTFAPNPDYGLQNERDYNNPVNRGKVIENSVPGRFDPAQVINDNADATAGPPVTDAAGNALAGNGRKMMIDRAYAAEPGKGLGYKDLLTQRAGQFGSTPEAVQAMREPVLTRVVSGAAPKDAIRDMNIAGTAALTPAEQAIADARRVSQPTLDHVSSELEARGPDATMAQVLEGKGGIDVLNKLMADGVISQQETAALRTETQLTAAGKQRIASLMTGRFFRDAQQLDSTPAAITAKIERIAAPTAATEAEGAYNLTPHVKGAVDLLEAQRAAGAATLDDYLSQSSLFARDRYSPESIELARRLQTSTPTELTAAVRKYGAEAKYAGDYQGSGLMGDVPDPFTPREAFNQAFKTELKEQPEAAAPPPSQVPTKPADFDASFPKPPGPTQRVPAASRSYENVRRLDSSLGQMIREGHTGDGALIGNNGVQYLQKVRNAVRADLSTFAENSGAQDVATAAKAADTYYQQVRAPFKKLDISRAATATDADKIFDGFIQAGSKEKAQRYYDALDDRGRAAVRSQMAMDAVNSATDNIHGTVDPEKLFGTLAKMKDPYGVFFKGTDKFELDGLHNFAKQEILNTEAAKAKPAPAAPAVNTARREAANTIAGARQRFAEAKQTAAAAKAAASEANDVVKATNARLNKYPLGTVAGAGMVGADALTRLGMPHVAVVSASIGGAAGLVKALTMTDVGRRFLLAGSTLQPGSRAMANLVARFSELVVPAARVPAMADTAAPAAGAASQ